MVNLTEAVTQPLRQINKHDALYLNLIYQAKPHLWMKCDSTLCIDLLIIPSLPKFHYGIPVHY